MLAAQSGDLRAVSRLLAAGAAVNARSNGRWTALMYAVSRRHLLVVKYLLSHGATSRVRGREWTSPLGLAWEAGDRQILGALVHAGADINDPRDDLLGNAAREGRLELAKTLIDLGADPNSGHSYDRPLHEAIQRRNGYLDKGIPGMVALLLQAGAKPEQEDLLTAMYVECTDPARPITELVLQTGVSVNSIDSLGRTPLFYAVGNGDEVMVKRLVGLGAKLEAPDQMGRTALELAATIGDTAMVALLLKEGSSVSAGRNSSPMSAAADNGHPAIVKQLSAAGAKSGLIESRALRSAARHLDVSTVVALLEAGADPNLDEAGATALALALGDPQLRGEDLSNSGTVREQTLALTKIILATPSLSQASKDNALYWALIKQPKEILELLVAAGAKADATK